MSLHDKPGHEDSNTTLPLGGLLALATAAFITLLTEIMPAGMLSSIAGGLDVSESLAGQFITSYAMGALIAAVPITVLTQGMRRRPLLLTAILGFAAVNLVTAISDNYQLSIAARFMAGVFGGIVWSLLAGYAARMSPAHLGGRAIAISGAGATIALVVGVPVGAFLSQIIGWQWSFGIMSIVAFGLTLWIIAIVPDFPGQPKDERRSFRDILANRNILHVLFVVMSFVLAHNVLYIYIEPFLSLANLSADVDKVLFVFGLGSLASILLVGMLVDRHLQLVAVASISLFALASTALGIWGDVSQFVYASVAVWGLGFGGFAAITQTALSRFAGTSVDVAQSMYTTGWNLAVAVGGIVGGVLLDRSGVSSFAWVVTGLVILSLFITIFGMNRSLNALCKCQTAPVV